MSFSVPLLVLVSETGSLSDPEIISLVREANTSVRDTLSPSASAVLGLQAHAARPGFYILIS